MKMKSTKKIARLLAMVMILTMTLGCFAGAADTTTASSGKVAPQGQWYTSYVQWALDQGYLNNIPDWEFAPDEPMNRAQFITVMATIVNGMGRNCDEKYSVAERNTFTDVGFSDYYSTYVYWGYDNGIINGTSDTTYEPLENITREQVATILGRAIGALNITLDNAADAVPTYADVDKISDWAAPSAELMRKFGIIQGDQYNCFNPQDDMTQAEALTMVYRVVTRNTSKLHVHTYAPTETMNGFGNYNCTGCDFKVYAKAPTIPAAPKEDPVEQPTTPTDDYRIFNMRLDAGNSRGYTIYIKRITDNGEIDEEYTRTKPDLIASRDGNYTSYNLLGFDGYYRQTKLVDTSRPITQENLNAFIADLGFEGHELDEYYYPYGTETPYGNVIYLYNEWFSGRRDPQETYDRIAAAISRATYGGIIEPKINDLDYNGLYPSQFHLYFDVTISDGEIATRGLSTWTD